MSEKKRNTVILPDLEILAKASLVKNNLPEFEAAFREKIDSFRYLLASDEDFVNAKEDIKILKDTEEILTQTEKAIVNGSKDIRVVCESMAALRDEARKLRLDRSKEIKEREVTRIQEIKEEAVKIIPVSHPDAGPRIEAAMKGKRSMESRQKHAEAEALAMKDEVEKAQAIIDRYRGDHEDVCYGETKLYTLTPDLVDAELSARVERKLAAIKENKLREEAEKLKAEALAAKEFAEAEAGVKAKADQEKENPQVEESSPNPTPEPETPSTPAATTPPPPEPSPKADESVSAELQGYISGLKTCLAPMRPARLALTHPENRAKADEFAAAINTAFQKLIKTGGGKS